MSTVIAENTAIAQEIGQLEGQLATADAAIIKSAAELALTRRRRTSAVFTVLAAIIGILGIGHLWPLWVFVGAAGVATLVMSFFSARNAQKERDQKQTWVTQAKTRLAYLKAQ